jgi:hypothetical protein
MSRRSKRAQQSSCTERKRQEKCAEKKPPSLCIYCGIRAAVKNEHVVGKVFFHALPLNMITVPSCAACDSGRGDGGPRDLHLDEEYFRNVLCLRTDMDAHPVANLLFKGPVIRSFERSAGLAKTILGTSHMATPRAPQGIILPPQMAFNTELHRIARVIRKIVKGLFYAKGRKRLPDHCEIGVYPDLSHKDFGTCRAMCNEGSNQWFGLGDNVFKCITARELGKPFNTIWLMVFYDNYAVFAYTHPE